jgi:hypothetical protein
MSVNIKARPFAYNTGSTITGTKQIGDLAIGIPRDGFPEFPEFWNGPNEGLGYVIAYPQPDGLHHTSISGKTASLGFWRSKFMTDESFLALVKNKTGQVFSTGTDAKTWLNNNGYWTSYLSPVLSLDASTYTSGNWVDSVGGKSFTLYNSPTPGSINGGPSYDYINFNAASSQYAECASSLSDLDTWSIETWHYYTGNIVGDGACIITEVYPGYTSRINYSLGDNYSSSLSSGFFDGGWQTSGGYNLSPNNWYHIVGTYDGTSNNLYVNGSLVQSNSYSGSPTSSQGGIRLMRRWDNPSYWDGKLAILNVYPDAMSSIDVSSKWNAGRSRFGLDAPSWPSGLTARYSADSYTSGSVLADLSGNGFDMDLTNPVFVTSGANKYFTSNTSTYYRIPGNSTIYSTDFTWSVALDITGAPNSDWGSIFWSETGGKNLIIGYYGTWWNGSPAFAPRIDTPSRSHQPWNYNEGFTNQNNTPGTPATCNANYSTTTPLSVLTVRKNGTTFEWFLNNEVIWTDTITDWNIPYINNPISFLSYSQGFYASNANFTDVAMFGRAIDNTELARVVTLMAKNI